MSIDVTKFVVDAGNPNLIILMDICKSLSKPLNYKIRDRKIHVKGGKKIPVEDLTRFTLKVNEPDEGIRPTGGLLEPVWRDEVKSNVQLNLLPMIAYGLSAIVLFMQQLAGHIVQHGHNGLYLRNTDTQKVGTGVDGKRILQIKFLLDNMLVTCPEVASRDALDCAAQISDCIMNGEELTAAMLLSMINDNDYISSSFVFMADILESKDKCLGGFEKIINYKIGRGECAVTCTERACIALACLWVMDLVEFMNPMDIQFNLEGARASYQRNFWQAMGNDEVGALIRTGVSMKMSRHRNGSMLSRNECDNDYLFNHLYGSKTKHGMCKDMHVFNEKAFNCSCSYFTMLKMCTDTIDDLKDESSQRLNEINRLTAELDRFRNDSGRNISAERAENEKLLCDNKTLEFQNERLKQRISALEEELNVLKSDVLTYYSDESADELVEVSTTPIEECVEVINQYSIVVMGGDAGFTDKLAKYNIGSVQVYRDQTRIPVSNTSDFYCVFAKYVSHKAVYFLQSHFDTTGRLFYFNGTNVEMFIRATYKFIMDYFEL